MNFLTSLFNFGVSSVVGAVASEVGGPEAGYVARKATGFLLNQAENADNGDDSYDSDFDFD
ncbi:MAG: hypothetical protein F6K40_36500 [Okeania sp. SIO3I5]|uniref:hypothetical protein n=1 Tax=Okeania sp. SIO3I5 TaxID=2607805 RepID=UPI0013B74D8B|nr:hypothetical protein [Okeania sp. SIO3I5]NEQ41402.1 hypothetical protein [Okeania sp. SIO3I5]